MSRLVAHRRAAILFFFVLCIVLPVNGVVLPATAGAEPLVLAQVSDRPKKDFKQLLPMARYMADRLQAYGFNGAQVQLYDSAEALIGAVRQGEVHWISETPYTSARLMQETASTPLAKKWKNGQQQYQTMIFTLKRREILSLQDLVGQRIAFEHPDSFSSYFLPRRILENAGLSLVELERPEDPVPEGQVGYLFSRNEKNNALWVDKEIVAAGTLNNGDWLNPDRVMPEMHERFHVIHRSAFYPRAFELATPALSPEAALALREELLALSQENHAGLLARYEQTEQFSPLELQDLNFLQELTDTGGRAP
ncbi:phosphate/phosphite/phosphonate ABC transporter substrate-binding protein [Marinobacterium mangrovicola]|uniref:ABC-type phosphate/phosphonate transport system substrate-binding protein n=1 Tax=Marinobacterium mangrovicola TaxID=1476959 RepID=A0A4R1GA57_9GAMM|nr:PhnD/SsuA/transferrin family substrate-binding protein [Marinobacterium mangrovicola]TCK03520.1 ABC-type phosphate/phosphonate transport system substrate-binding protein [Marinobacterium mangrovicola]